MLGVKVMVVLRSESESGSGIGAGVIGSLWLGPQLGFGPGVCNAGVSTSLYVAENTLMGPSLASSFALLIVSTLSWVWGSA